ncbi:hypothetical protein QP888_02085 [Corynebacterium sp. MSK297]|uniref:hypothetical protein n=1 Tax=Corynebacterium sp. MSK297 TaxID=3050221 RepID=UPI00254ACFA3|nr:hypothetical protein [Corynebacterium sp. MSK297]MDK8845319.1 hypothetical protein [Corynebacterium sp. MSK297]
MTVLDAGSSLMVPRGTEVHISELDEFDFMMEERISTPPACIEAKKEAGGFIQVYNNCGIDLRVKVILAFAPDSRCAVVVDNSRHNIAWAPTGRVDRIELC